MSFKLRWWENAGLEPAPSILDDGRRVWPWMLLIYVGIPVVAYAGMAFGWWE